MNEIPKSTATNAYELLGEVRELIVAEPKRYNQNIVRIQGDALEQSQYDKPQCGTVGCIAGWVITLKAPDVPVPTCGATGMVLAADILGLQYELDTDGTICGQAWELFADVLDDEDGDECVAVPGKPQTADHARYGAQHIDAFREKYADQLKSKPV